MTIKKLGKYALFLVLIAPVLLFSKIEFTQKVSKQNAYINETIKVTLILKIDNYHNITQVYFEDYETSDFWYKKHEEKIIEKNSDNTTYTYSYLLNAKSSGKFVLPKQVIEISNEEIRNYRRWEKIYSNEIDLDIKPTVENLSIQGDYEIKAFVDKTEINESDSVKLTLEIKGSGNIKDIKPFNLDLNKQVVYDNKPIITEEFKQTKYYGSFTQEFLVIANESFTVKPFEFTYFDINKNRVQKISTNHIFVNVNKSLKNNGDKYWVKYLFLTIGIIVGILGAFVYLNYKRRKTQFEMPLVVKIKKAKNDKELYKVLISHSNEYYFDKVIKKLEENIYKSGKNRVFKKDIINYVLGN